MVFCFRKRKSGRLTACLLRFLSQLQQSTDTSGDRVLGDWRVGETAELLKGRVGMVESELAGGFKIVRNVVAEDFKGLAPLIPPANGPESVPTERPEARRTVWRTSMTPTCAVAPRPPRKPAIRSIRGRNEGRP